MPDSNYYADCRALSDFFGIYHERLHPLWMLDLQAERLVFL
jgi:hypothetical protein